jgi:hypothetical protein
VQVSGFTLDELLGKAHNLVRHPHMPPEAFEDMWRTIQAGSPWTALVKNRCKNGDHYWVRANVTPVMEQGDSVGFLSVRTLPSRDEVARAESLYAAIRAGKIRNGRFDGGRWVRRDPVSTALRRLEGSLFARNVVGLGLLAAVSVAAMWVSAPVGPVLWGATAVVLALAATYLLAVDEIQAFTGQPLGLVFILSAAIFWGIGNAMIKHSPLSISTVVLNFWSLAISCVLGFMIAVATEVSDWRWPSVIEWAGVFYNSLIAFALGYVAWFTVARKLSAVTSGLSIMLVPVIAVFGGAFWLSEAITWEDLLALALILAAMAAVLMPGRRAA